MALIISGPTSTGSIHRVYFTLRPRCTLFSTCCLGSICAVGASLWVADAFPSGGRLVRYRIAFLMSCLSLGLLAFGGTSSRHGPLKLRSGVCSPPGPGLLAATLSPDGRSAAGIILVPSSPNHYHPSTTEVRIWDASTLAVKATRR